MTDNTGTGANIPGATGTPPPGAGSPPVGLPEGLPAQFWDNDKGAVDAAGLTAAWRELADAKAARDAGVPAHASGYRLELPPDFKIEGLPDGAQFTFDVNDPRVPVAREASRELGLDQAGFSKLLALDARFQFQRAQAERAAASAEAAKLGEKFSARKAAVESFLEGVGGQGAAEKIAVASAEGFEVLEKIIAMALKSSVPGAGPEYGETKRQLTMAERWFPNTPPQQKVR